VSDEESVHPPTSTDAAGFLYPARSSLRRATSLFPVKKIIRQPTSSCFSFFLKISSFAMLSLYPCGSIARADEPARYYYTGKAYGSESLYNPLSVIINGGYDVLQASAHSRVLSDPPYRIGFNNVWDNISDPLPQINKFGWNRFIGQELFPLSLSIDKAQYFPNYTLHLIGGGMEYRMMAEWYEYNGVPAPQLFSVATMAAYHLLNETVENDRYVGVNVDPIADLLVFDPAGIILFLSDDVAEFFSTTLHLSDWSGQPAINPRFRTLENHGQNFSMKYRPPFWDRTSFFYYFGDNGLIGLSFHQPDGYSLSCGGGAVAKELRTVDTRNGTRTVSVTLGWIAGIFYDRENSLLASLILSNQINERMKLNLYPGVLNAGSLSPGLFCGLGQGNQFTAGITFRYSPVGIAYRNKK
jgi:hypothetical protein